MTSIGVGLWVFQRTGETTPLLLAAFFAELPGMLGGSLAGVVSFPASFNSGICI